MKKYLIALVALAILYVLSVLVVERWPQSNPPFAFEVPHVSLTGTVTFESVNYEQTAHRELIAGLRTHTPDLIRLAIYADGLTYCFSSSGRVFALASAENDNPAIFEKSWDWSGAPHDFPHFSYSKTSPYVTP